MNGGQESDLQFYAQLMSEMTDAKVQLMSIVGHQPVVKSIPYISNYESNNTFSLSCKT